MKKNVILLFVFLCLFCQNNFAQNYVIYTPLTQAKTIDSGVEVTATILASCYGNSTNSVYINPTYCAWDDGLKSISFSNGTYLVAGQTSTITFKFKKTVTSNYQFLYKFSTNGSCFSSDINITINYNVSTPSQSCSLPAPTNLLITNIQQTSASLSWDHVPNNQGYRIYYDVNNSFVDVNTNSYTFTNLKPGTSYGCNVRAKHSTCVTYANYNGGFTTLCSPLLAPTNISATPLGTGYIINFTNVLGYTGYYVLDYVDLTNNSTGSLTIYQGANFYYVAPPQSFKFRIRPQNGVCYAPPSDWLTVIPDLCPSNNFPSNLVYSPTNFSGCNSGNGRCCGYGIFSWSQVSAVNMYLVEYICVNLTNPNVTPLIGTFQTANINSYQPTPYACNSNQAGTWVIKFRVKSRCSNGTWSDYSPWTSNFLW